MPEADKMPRGFHRLEVARRRRHCQFELHGHCTRQHGAGLQQLESTARGLGELERDTQWNRALEAHADTLGRMLRHETRHIPAVGVTRRPAETGIDRQHGHAG